MSDTCFPDNQLEASREALLVALWDLYRHLRGQHDSDSSPCTQDSCIPERWVWFVGNSNLGENCGYAKKYRDMFWSRGDWNYVKKALIDVITAARKLEGDSFCQTQTSQ